ncbi:MAG: hypothetical protein OES46_09410 [Gammaproteobacteria bacterium]|nr:hypothetical protein [Gammaproteobacteria bacterium]
MVDDSDIHKRLLSGLDSPADTDRLARVVSRAHRQVATKDLIVLFLGRMWAVLAALSAPLFKFSSTTRPSDPATCRDKAERDAGEDSMNI